MDLNSTPKELQNFEAVLDLVVPLKTVTCSGIGWPFCQTFGWTGLNCWNLSERSQKNSDLNSGFGQNYFFDSGLGQNYFSDIDSGSGQNFSDSWSGQFFFWAKFFCGPFGGLTLIGASDSFPVSHFTNMSASIFLFASQVIIFWSVLMSSAFATSCQDAKGFGLEPIKTSVATYFGKMNRGFSKKRKIRYHFWPP